nr:1549_t:CDS:2 [Entrophospora candida]
MQQDNGHEDNKENKQEMQVPPSEHEPTATIYIKNFVRPLTHTKVRELLEQYGKIEFFWMDKIKSHCYVKTWVMRWGLLHTPWYGRIYP